MSLSPLSLPNFSHVTTAVCSFLLPLVTAKFGVKPMRKDIKLIDLILSRIAVQIPVNLWVGEEMDVACFFKC